MFTTHVHNFQKSEDDKTPVDDKTTYNLLRLIQENKNLFDFLNSVQFESNDFTFVSLPMIKLIFKHLMEEEEPPLRFIVPGRVYRNEAISYKSYCLQSLLLHSHILKR